MMAEILAFVKVSQARPESSFWKLLAMSQEHVEWSWIGLHDMIQPSFTFLVGVVLPYSLESRRKRGATVSSIMGHTVRRSLILIFLGIFLRSLYSEQTYFTFEDTLTQIGLGYTVLVMLGFFSRRVQVAALIIILAGYWLAFALYPLPGPGFDYTQAGVSPDWERHFSGFMAHWNKNTNLAWAFDRWFLNLFPRETVFRYNGGGYTTLGFIPTLGTMILGLLAGDVLKNTSKTPAEKIRFFIIFGVALTAGGAMLHLLGVNPVVKRLWTPAWTIFSGGLCTLCLAFFYYLVDVAGKKKWSFFFMVIGMNSIVAYVMAESFAQFISRSLHIHLGKNYDHLFGASYAPVVNGVLVLLIEWLILWWMYRKKLFIKI